MSPLKDDLSANGFFLDTVIEQLNNLGDVAVAYGIAVFLQMCDKSIDFFYKVVAVFDKQFAPHFSVESCNTGHVFEASGGQSVMFGSCRTLNV